MGHPPVSMAATTKSAPSPSTASALALPPHRALALPLVFALGLASFCFLESIRQNPRVLWSFLGAAAALIAWNVLLLNVARSRGRTFTLEIVLRKQHYVQACAQGAVLLYWGWYWRQVYASAHFIAAQLLFAYAFDVLLTLVSARYLRPGLRSVSGDLQHQPVSLVQTGLVLSAVPHGGPRLCRQTADLLGQGRTARPHLQPLIVSACGVFAGADSDGLERPHVGSGHREHAVLPAADVSDAVSHRAAGTVLLRRDNDDDVGGGGDVPFRAFVPTRRRAFISSTIHISRLRSSSACTSCSPIHPRRRAPSSDV